MKKYLVFIGSNYYPNAGVKDFKKDFDDLSSAQSFAIKSTKKNQWYQIATNNFEVVEFKEYDPETNEFISLFY